ncbi:MULTISPECIES: hydroxyphenylacetyl-CoA thioesterase PaaI [Arthrobacter]|uniref:Hydroxyphenylacetyl-CoA thioesterase PaaI n=2 Tax=Arthrobacter TaxID=1663 RepID=A0ABU9KL85_9MICC|nr:hydroxyphenylacetyl-CoA thioesterase PaaI [Arthrobacter sp. YJM1]MDP5227325.1 hydroxyphenylacetyl-CoA thioesterase PaaI [Arthrobacter sp. YJM1]
MVTGTDSQQLDPRTLAKACADTMWSTDEASQGLGMALESVEPGQAVLTMTVRSDMVNGHGICHGGFISTLADSTFAFSCNTHNVVTVASGFEISFLESARLGDVLRAEGREVVLRGRSGIYDVTVRRGDTVIAVFRGRSRSLGRPILEETP